MRALLNSDTYKLINIYGMDGIGRTRFAQEIGYYLFGRYKYMDGIFMFDVKKIKLVD